MLIKSQCSKLETISYRRKIPKGRDHVLISLAWMEAMEVEAAVYGVDRTTH